MRLRYLSRSLVLAALIALAVALPRAPDVHSQRNAKRGLEASPVTVTKLDRL